jgi:competence protein ComEA
VKPRGDLLFPLRALKEPLIPETLHPGNRIQLSMRTLNLLLASLLLVFLAGCTSPQNPDQIRERTANATAQIKTDTKAVAEGIKEGLGRNPTVDINSAPKEDLMKLQGITDARAERIIAARPYNEATELVTRKVLTKAEYDQIATHVTVKK